MVKKCFFRIRKVVWATVPANAPNPVPRWRGEPLKCGKALYNHFINSVSSKRFKRWPNTKNNLATITERKGMSSPVCDLNSIPMERIEFLSNLLYCKSSNRKIFVTEILSWESHFSNGKPHKISSFGLSAYRVFYVSVNYDRMKSQDVRWKETFCNRIVKTIIHWEP